MLTTARHAKGPWCAGMLDNAFPGAPAGVHQSKDEILLHYGLRKMT